MGSLRFAAAQPEDLGELFKHMRRCDWDEVVASSGDDVWGSLERSLKVSDDPVACRDRHGKLVCLSGVSPASLLSDVGYIWLLGTDRMARNAKNVFAEAKRYFEFISERYPILMNYVDARNGPSIRWLRRLGFTIDPPTPYGVAGLPFHRFHKGLDSV